MWTTNVPTVDSVLLAWLPCQEPSPVANVHLLISSVVHQKWKGLAIKHFEGKGKGETTNICNYLEEQQEASFFFSKACSFTFVQGSLPR